MNKTRSLLARVAQSRAARGIGAAALGFGALVGNAMADLPVDVETKLTTTQTDTATMGTYVLVAIVGIFAFKLLRRAL